MSVQCEGYRKTRLFNNQEGLQSLAIFVGMLRSELKAFLDEKADQYNNPEFIENDPIQVPHQFEVKEDIEIAGFLTATIAWGNRNTIIKNAQRMMELMELSPYDFVLNHSERDLVRMNQFVHRTFNHTDLMFFITSLKHIYTHHGGMEQVFQSGISQDSVLPAITHFKHLFFSIAHESRTTKHVSDPAKGSAAKRLNMMLRWFCRTDNKGVDFGIWKSISPSILSCPLDVHTGNVARQLKLIKRKQNDVNALHELDKQLRLFDSKDPVKYDFALFGIGVNKELIA